jgi:hypothetical protein
MTPATTVGRLERSGSGDDPGDESLQVMFHIQLRQFPHNACHFNMTEPELHALLAPWVCDRWIEVGERKWSPYQAKLTIVEGPHLEVEDLSMGRGWPNAQHQGKKVTERVITEVRASLQAPVRAPPAVGSREAAPEEGPRATPTPAPAPAPARAGAQLGDGPVLEGPGEELRTLLGEDPEGLLQAWRLAAGRRPELSPSECLALAEETLRSLGSSTP